MVRGILHKGLRHTLACNVALQHRSPRRALSYWQQQVRIEIERESVTCNLWIYPGVGLNGVLRLTHRLLARS